MSYRTEALEKCRAWLNAHENEMIEDLKAFVACRSVSRADLAAPGAPFGPENAEMLNRILWRAARFGFETKNGNGYYGTVTLGKGDDAVGIIAHADVVPEGEGWIHEPYVPVREGDFLFGRGSSDNKSACVSALYVMRMIKELNLPVRHGVRLIVGLSEETGMQDMVAYNLAEKPCRVTLVPDACFPVCYAQKGSLSARVKIARGESLARFEGGEVDNMVPPQAECVVRASAEEAREALNAAGFHAPEYEVSFDAAGAKIVAHGVASHAASPEHGKSAILMLACALEEAGLVEGASLGAVRAIRFLAQGCHGAHMGIACEDPDTGKTTMTVGIARTHADEIELHADCRLSVAANPEETAERFAEAARAAGFEVLETKTTSPVYIDKADPRVQALQKAYFELTGDKAEPYTMGGGTYSRCMENAITYGLSFLEGVRPEGLPQGHGGVHAPDEFLYIPHWMKGTMILLNAVLALDEIV